MTWKTERNMRTQIMNTSAHINTGITSFNFMPYYTSSEILATYF